MDDLALKANYQFYSWMIAVFKATSVAAGLFCQCRFLKRYLLCDAAGGDDDRNYLLNEFVIEL